MNSTCRVEKNRENPYVMINKDPLYDERLSWKAKGMLAYFLSKPDGWKVIVGDLVKRSVDGEKAVYSGLRELKKYGYLEKKPVRKDGKIAYWENVIYEVPLETIELLAQNRQVDEPIENTDSELLAQNVQVENVNVENRQRNNNDFNNKDFKDVVVEETTNDELSLELMKKINDLNFKFKYTFSLNDIDSILDAYSNNLDLINDALEYMIESEPKKGFKNFVGYLIKAKGYKSTSKEIKNEFQAPGSNGGYIKLQDKPKKKKTDFHLAKSRGDKYSASELEEMILAKSREKIKNIKKE